MKYSGYLEQISRIFGASRYLCAKKSTKFQESPSIFRRIRMLLCAQFIKATVEFRAFLPKSSEVAPSLLEAHNGQKIVRR